MLSAHIQCSMPHVDRASIELNQQFKCRHNGIQLNYCYYSIFREGKINEISTTDSGAPRARARTHIISWDIFIYSLL